MKGKALLMVLLGAALVAAAQDFGPVEAPAASDDSMANGPVEAADTSDKPIDVNAIEPMETPTVEADGDTDDAPDVSGEEMEAAPSVDAEPAPGTEAGDAPDLP